MIKKLVFLAVSLALVAGGALVLWMASLEIPDFDSFQERVVSQSTKIYDRTGTVLLYSVHENVRRRLISGDDISRHIKNATVAIEDNEFYEHRGIKPLAIFRALLVNLGAGSRVQGGSTITQQLIKNAVLTQEKKIARKIKEAVLALKIEQQMGKDEILALYLNENPYGGNIYGVEEASLSFFNKHASDVSLAEAAYLAAIPKAPTFYSPYGNNKASLDERKDLVLDRMAALNFITAGEAAGAKTETVIFRPPEDRGLKAPHFVIWVRDYLESKYGDNALTRQGFKVITTLDWELQKKAEAAVAKFGPENEKTFNAGNAGLVAVDPSTGQVLAMVGSRDYFDVANDGNYNVALARRQPGSAFKPFAYATAFNKGYTPETVVFDLATQFDTACAQDRSRCYTPTNYDGRYRGPINLRQALAQSINIPAIKVLYLAGISDTLRLARRLGITSLADDPNRYGLPLVLGGGEVSLLEMTSAYGVFANEGVRHPVANILRVENLAGEVVEEFQPRPEEILPANTARLISSILSDNAARTPIFGPSSPMHFANRDVASKTGTTNDNRDAWVIGYAPNLSVGVWVGNNDNTPMAKGAAGYNANAPMWRDFFSQALADLPNVKFAPPGEPSTELRPIFRGFWQGGESYFLDKISGKRATEYTPADLLEEKVLTQIHSILFWINRADPLGPPPSDPARDPQFNFWEGPVRQWAATQNIREETWENIVQEVDDIHRPEYSPQFQITQPSPSQNYSPSQPLPVVLEFSSGRFPIDRAEFYLNESYLGATRGGINRFTVTASQIGEAAGASELRVVVYDAVKNRSEQKVSVRWGN